MYGEVNNSVSAIRLTVLPDGSAERRSASPVIRETQIKISVRHHLTPGGWPPSKRQQVTSVGEGVEKRAPPSTAGGDVNCCSHRGKQYGVFSEN